MLYFFIEINVSWQHRSLTQIHILHYTIIQTNENTTYNLTNTALFLCTIWWVSVITILIHYSFVSWRKSITLECCMWRLSISWRLPLSWCFNRLFWYGQHSTRMCLTVRGLEQSWHSGGSSDAIRYPCVKRVCPMGSLLMRTLSFLFKFVIDMELIVDWISLNFDRDLLQYFCHNLRILPLNRAFKSVWNRIFLMF